MSKKYEYKIFNFSEIRDLSRVQKGGKLKPVTWVDKLNEYGQEGWKLHSKPTTESFLLEREVIPEAST